MTRYLFPRLHQSAAASLWAARESDSVESLYSQAATSNHLEVFASTGGTRIDDATLKNFADEVRKRALNSGFPQRNSSGFREFDIRTAAWLADSWPGYVGEALRPDTWAFLTSVLLPDITLWRWPARTAERLYGPLHRNALGRLWLHGSLLQREGSNDWNERWEPLRYASEDFLLNLIERTSLSANRHFALAVAEEWLKWREGLRHSQLEQLHRSALKRLRLLTTTVDPAVLEADQRAEIIAEAFRLSYESITPNRQYL